MRNASLSLLFQTTSWVLVEEQGCLGSSAIVVVGHSSQRHTCRCTVEVYRWWDYANSV